MNADDFGHEESDWLAEHAGFRFDAADAPADDAEAVDHRRVRVGADECVGVEDAIFFEHAFGEVLEVHLVNDADAGWHDFEGIECLLAPFQELVAFAVAVEFKVEVAVERVAGAGVIHLHRVVDDEVDRHEGFDHFRIAAHAIDGRAHRGEVDQKRHAGEVLQDDACDHEWDLIVAGIFCIVGSEVGDVLVADLESVVVAKERFQHDADRDRQAGEVGKSLFGESGQRVEFALGSGAGGEGAECVHGGGRYAL